MPDQPAILISADAYDEIAAKLRKLNRFEQVEGVLDLTGLVLMRGRPQPRAMPTPILPKR